MAEVAGLVLAAGAGTRFGGPKALARGDDGRPWVARVVETLQHAGCATVTVVLGAEAELAGPLVPAGATVLVASDWASGMSASLAAGLASLEASDAIAALVAFVDMPGLPVSVCARVLGAHPAASSLRRARYSDRPGHPVLIGRAHWAPMRASLTADKGGRSYLQARGVQQVDCTDLFGGADIDHR